MPDSTILGVAAVPFILGLVEAAKRKGLPSNAAPALAVLIGFVGGIAYYYAPMLPWIQPAVVGMSLGLAASGLYSGGKATFGRPAPVRKAPAKTVTRTVTPAAAAPATPTE